MDTEGRAQRRLARVEERLGAPGLDVVRRLLLTQERLDLESQLSAPDPGGARPEAVPGPPTPDVARRAGEDRSPSQRRLARVVELLTDAHLDVVRRLLLTQERLDLETTLVAASEQVDPTSQASPPSGSPGLAKTPEPAAARRRPRRRTRTAAAGGAKPSALRQRAVPDREENLALARLVHGDDPRSAAAARVEMLVRNERLVRSIAARFRTVHLSMDDLVQEGTVGLDRAIDKFDPERGFAFSTYATWWIRQAISRAIDNGENAIRVPVGALGRHAAALDRGDGGVATVARARAPMVQLDREPLDGQAVVEVPAPDDDALAAVENRMVLARSLRALERFEVDLLFARFGVGYPEPVTLEIVASVLGVSKERVRQIEISAMRRAKGDAGAPVALPQSFGDRALEPALREAVARAHAKRTHESAEGLDRGGRAVA